MRRGWICDLCGKFYDTEKEATKCENDHPKIISTDYIYNNNDIPKRIKVIFKYTWLEPFEKFYKIEDR
jgi:hypothetical protein